MFPTYKSRDAVEIEYASGVGRCANYLLPKSSPVTSRAPFINSPAPVCFLPSSLTAVTSKTVASPQTTRSVPARCYQLARHTQAHFLPLFSHRDAANVANLPAKQKCRIRATA